MAERDAARTRARIMEIAGELFRSQGYAGTSISDIATRLGTSKSALREKDERIVAALAGPAADPAATIRARAAVAVAKDATREVMVNQRGSLGDAEREELLAAALRALTP